MGHVGAAAAADTAVNRAVVRDCLARAAAHGRAGREHRVRRAHGSVRVEAFPDARSVPCVAECDPRCQSRVSLPVMT